MKKLLLAFVLCLIISPALAEQRIVFTRSDGAITVRHLPSGASPQDFTDAIQHAIDSGEAVNIPIAVDQTAMPTVRTFRNAWRQSNGAVSVDMPTARGIHAEHIARAHAAEIARVKTEERSERLKGNTTKADAHAATVTALEALDLNVLAMQIANAPNPTALKAVWPMDVPR